MKTSRLPGPLSDVFSDAYVVAWRRGGDDRRFVAAAEEAARSLSGEGPCFADVNLPEQFLRTHNLVLVGTPESSRWLARIDPCLPVRIMADRVAAGSREYEGHDLGCMLIYPNPLNVERYVVVFSATPARAMACLPQAYSRMKSVRPADIGIFEVTGTGGIRWHVLETFSTVWTWHEKYDRPIMTVKRERPRWGWHVAMICSVAGFKDFSQQQPEELRLGGVELRGPRDILAWLHDYRLSGKGLWLPKAIALEPPSQWDEQEASQR